MPESRNPEVSEELAEIAAKAMYEADRHEHHEPWDGGKGIMLSDEARDNYRRDGRNAALALAPILQREERERIVNLVTGEFDLLDRDHGMPVHRDELLAILATQQPDPVPSSDESGGEG